MTWGWQSLNHPWNHLTQVCQSCKILKEDPYPEGSESRLLGFCSTRFPCIPVTQKNIISARRIGKQGEGSKQGGWGSGLKPHPLVVEFCSPRMQQLILRENKCLQGSGVFISESLINSGLQLLSYTKSKLGKRSTWSTGGEIQSFQMVKWLLSKRYLKLMLSIS